MDESAYIFFTLLDESYRIDAEIRLGDITVNSVPHMDKESSKQVFESYKMQAGDILDLFNEGDVSSIEEIKKALGQK